MMPATKFYIVSADALPEIFIKVAEAKRMLQSGEVRTAGDAARASDHLPGLLEIRLPAES